MFLTLEFNRNMVFIFLNFASFLIIYDVFNISLVCVNIVKLLWLLKNFSILCHEMFQIKIVTPFYFACLSLILHDFV
jgi:hypothetical protein